MDTYEAEGFFPEREVMRARRLRATVQEPANPSKAHNRRMGMWVLWFTVFLTMFVNTIVFGWDGHITPYALEVIKYSLLLLLAACVGCVALALRGAFLRVNNRSSSLDDKTVKL